MNTYGSNFFFSCRADDVLAPACVAVASVLLLLVRSMFRVGVVAALVVGVRDSVAVAVAVGLAAFLAVAAFADDVFGLFRPVSKHDQDV